MNRYRVIGPFFAERLGPDSRTDRPGRRASRATRSRADVHVGVYNGEGYGRAEIDKVQGIDGRVTLRPFDRGQRLGNVTISGFYQVRLVRERSPAQRRASSWAVTSSPMSWPPAQYLSGHRQPVRRRGCQAPRPVVLRRRQAGSHRLGRRGRRGLLRPGRSTTQATRGAATSSAARTGVRWDAGGWVSW